MRPGLIVDDGDATTLINLLLDGGKTALAGGARPPEERRRRGRRGGEGGAARVGSGAPLAARWPGEGQGLGGAATRAVAAWEELRAAGAALAAAEMLALLRSCLRHSLVDDAQAVYSAAKEARDEARRANGKRKKPKGKAKAKEKEKKEDEMPLGRMRSELLTACVKHRNVSGAYALFLEGVEDGEPPPEAQCGALIEQLCTRGMGQTAARAGCDGRPRL